MKTSNILMTTAILIVLSSLVLYDFALKAEYLRMKELGENKQTNRFRDYEQAAFKDFSSIEFKAANVFSVSVEYGEKEAVWIKNDVKNKVAVNQIGENLVVDLSNEGKLKNYYSNDYYAIVIICSRLKKMNTEVFTFTEKDTDKGKKVKTKSSDFSKNEISGFEQDSLHLNIADHTKLTLNKNQFKYVNALVGSNSSSPGWGGALSIGADNNINSLKLTVQGKNSVEVLDTDIQNFEHHFSDSAKVTFSGISLQKLSNQVR